GKQFNFKTFGFGTGIFDLGKRLTPVQTVCLCCRECFWLLDGRLITFEILFFIRACCCFKIFGYSIDHCHLSLPFFCSISSREVNAVLLIVFYTEWQYGLLISNPAIMLSS